MFRYLYSLYSKHGKEIKITERLGDKEVQSKFDHYNNMEKSRESTFTITLNFKSKCFTLFNFNNSYVAQHYFCHGEFFLFFFSFFSFLPPSFLPMLPSPPLPLFLVHYDNMEKSQKESYFYIKIELHICFTLQL